MSLRLQPAFSSITSANPVLPCLSPDPPARIPCDIPERWGEGVSADAWPSLTDVLMDACEGDPSDPTLVKVAATLSQYFGESGCRRVLARVGAALDPRAEQALGGGGGGAPGIFGRLSPLLMLRLLPLEAFSEDLIGGFGCGGSGTGGASGLPIGARLLQVRAVLLAKKSWKRDCIVTASLICFLAASPYSVCPLRTAAICGPL